MKAHRICFYFVCFFHLTWLFWHSSILHTSVVHSFYCWIVFSCMDILQFVHSPVVGYLDCFHFLAFINNAAMNICIHVCVNICFPISWHHIDNLELAMITVFAPWKLENTTNPRLPPHPPPEIWLLNIYPHITRYTLELELNQTVHF